MSLSGEPDMRSSECVSFHNSETVLDRIELLTSEDEDAVT